MVDGSRLRIAAWAIAAVLATLAALRLMDGQRTAGGAPVRVNAGPAADRRSDHGRVYVHVAGVVRRPGLYRVPAGARLAAAIEQAGGPARGADLSAVNLAARLEDGQQVLVPKRGAAAPAAGSGGTGSGGPGSSQPAGGSLSLATATAQQLEELDGIGPTLARRIVEYREEHGGFRSVDQLKQVDGIGEKRFEALKEAVRP